MGTTDPREWAALVDERYALDRVIGRGGMGEVWAGVDLMLGRAVAVKVMHEHLAVDTVARNRFEREARAVASLNRRGVRRDDADSSRGRRPCPPRIPHARGRADEGR